MIYPTLPHKNWLVLWNMFWFVPFSWEESSNQLQGAWWRLSSVTAALGATGLKWAIEGRR